MQSLQSPCSCSCTTACVHLEQGQLHCSNVWDGGKCSRNQSFMPKVAVYLPHGNLGICVQLFGQNRVLVELSISQKSRIKLQYFLNGLKCEAESFLVLGGRDFLLSRRAPDHGAFTEFQLSLNFTIQTTPLISLVAHIITCCIYPFKAFIG